MMTERGGRGGGERTRKRCLPGSQGGRGHHACKGALRSGLLSHGAALASFVPQLDGSWHQLTQEAVLRHPAPRPAFLVFPLCSPARGWPRVGWPGEQGGFLRWLSEPGMHGSNFMNIWLIPQHSVVFGSKFTPQQTFCVGNENPRRAGPPLAIGPLASPGLLLMLSSPALRRAGAVQERRPLGCFLGCSLARWAANIWPSVLEQCCAPEEKVVVYKTVVLKVGYP